MPEFVAELLGQPVAGIPAEYWQKFLQIFAEPADQEQILRRLESIKTQVADTEWAKASPEEVDALVSAIENVVSKLN